MSGTISGGKETAKIIKKRDPDFYKRIGSIGGSRTGIAKGFAIIDKDLRSKISQKGGRASKRGKTK